MNRNQEPDAGEVERTAQHMLKTHTQGQYPAWERANDHAISYESNSYPFKFWCAVSARLWTLTNCKGA